MLKRIGAEESGEFKAIASGTLPSGKPVVVNADGTVSVVEEATTNISAGIGTEVTFESANSRPYKGTFDSANNKVIIVYQDLGNSSYGTAIVGTIDSSDNSISFGSAVVFNSASSPQISSTFDSSNNKVVIAYKDQGNNGYGTAIVGTVSGTSISFGSEAVFWNANTNGIEYIDLSFDTNVNKVLVSYSDNIRDGYGIAGTVSGTSISFGTAHRFESGQAYYLRSAFDNNSNVHVATYADFSNSQYGTAAVIQVASDGTVTSQTPVVWLSSEAQKMDIDFDTTNNKFLIAFRDVNLSGRASAIVGTVSGTTLTFGSKNNANVANSLSPAIAFDETAGKFVIIYDKTNLKYVTAEISGTSVSFGSEADVDTNSSADYNDIIYDSNQRRTVAIFQDSGSSSHGKARVIATAGSFTTPNLTSENYIGMSRGVIDVDSRSQALGSPAVYESAGVAEVGSAYDANAQKVVIAYRDAGNSNYGTAVVGTVSGTGISFGTPVVFESAVARYSAVAYDANAQKVVIAYKDVDNSNSSTAIVGTVSGTSISFGTAVVFDSNSSNDFAATYDANAQKVVIAYMTASDNGAAVVGTVSGTSISFGSVTQLENSRNNELSIAYDSANQKVVVAYKDADNLDHGTAVVGTVSGTSISFGTPAVFNAATSTGNSITYDSNSGKVVIAYYDGGNSNYGTAVVGTVSGTSISFGDEVVFETSNTSNTSAIYDASAQRIVIAYRANSVGNVIVGNVSGTSISFATSVQFESGAANSNTTIYDTNNSKVVISYQDGGNSDFGTAVVFQAAYENITRGEVAGGGNASIDIIGSVSDNQTNLTAGQQYFVQTDGTIGTTADSPSVLAGTTISATELLVKT